MGDEEGDIGQVVSAAGGEMKSLCHLSFLQSS